MVLFISKGNKIIIIYCFYNIVIESLTLTEFISYISYWKISYKSKLNPAIDISYWVIELLFDCVD